MKKVYLWATVAMIFVTAIFTSCEKEGSDPISDSKQTLFVYMPWSTDLTSYFEQNVRDFEESIRNNGLGNSRVVVFFSSSPNAATLFELKHEKSGVVRETIKSYQNPAFTTAEGITSILNDVVAVAPAERYAMVIGCHGMGWLPISGAKRVRAVDTEKYHWEYEGVLKTRFFGGMTPDVQTDVNTLATGIANAGLKMDYILFDDCYMSCIEVAYELKDVTDYLIASPNEVLIYGFPYHKIGKYLIGEFDLQGIVTGFYDFYANDIYPYGTVAVTVCRELDDLAAVMREINSRYTFDQELLHTIQPMDGYNPVIFYDYGDYVSKLCTDPVLLNRFEEQLERTVPSKLRLHTPQYYSMSRGPVSIDFFTGVTISDPSESTKAVATKTETAWYRATH